MNTIDAPSRPNRVAVKKKKRREVPIYRWFIPLMFAVCAGLTALYWTWREAAPRPFSLTGYISSISTIEMEYARFYGKPLADAEIRTQFQRAAGLMERRDYSKVVTVLEGVAREAAVPAIFNDLGLIYVELNDRSRAVNAFREALARDVEYRPVRENLHRLNGFLSISADPVSVEVESNETAQTANVVALMQPVEAEVESASDVDYYKFTAPAAPRDMVAIEVASHSQYFNPAVSVFDEEMRPVDTAHSTATTGIPIQLLAPQPNAPIFIRVSGLAKTAGRYTLTVHGTKTFDSYEPNDDIFGARKLAIGESAEANIMDDKDTDYYSFVSPRSGTVSIELENRSNTLIPVLTTFTPDMRTSGFGPDVRTPGKGLHHSLRVEANQVYYLQIWSLSHSSGAYTLTIN